MIHRSVLSPAIRAALAVSFTFAAMISAKASTPGELYVTNFNAGRIDRYDTVDGLVGGARSVGFISGLSIPTGIVVSGGQIFVESYTLGTISVYDAATGHLINANLITGLDHPWGLAVSGGELFVTNVGNGSTGTGFVGAYTTSGTTVNANLITGLTAPRGIAVGGSISGNTNALFVATSYDSQGHQHVGEYTTAGGTVNASFITAMQNPYGVAVSGNNLFVSNVGNSTIYEYDATSGANLSLDFTHGGAASPEAIAVDNLGLNLYVANTAGNPNGFVDDFSLTSGTLVASPGMGSMDAPTGIFYVPEPSSVAALFVGMAMLTTRRRRAGGC